jgi:hypothetical protein
MSRTRREPSQDTHETDRVQNHPDNIPPIPGSPETARADVGPSSVREPDHGSTPKELSKTGDEPVREPSRGGQATGSSLDHGNCELCNELETTLAQVRAERDDQLIANDTLHQSNILLVRKSADYPATELARENLTLTTDLAEARADHEHTLKAASEMENALRERLQEARAAIREAVQLLDTAFGITVPHTAWLALPAVQAARGEEEK